MTSLLKKSLVSKDFHLAINISGKQLKDSDFIEKVDFTIKKANLSPSTIILEITERSILDDFEKVKDILTELTKLGVKFHLDDFGEGYTSLKLLRDFKCEMGQGFYFYRPINDKNIESFIKLNMA